MSKMIFRFGGGFRAGGRLRRPMPVQKLSSQRLRPKFPFFHRPLRLLFHIVQALSESTEVAKKIEDLPPVFFFFFPTGQSQFCAIFPIIFFPLCILDFFLFRLGP